MDLSSVNEDGRGKEFRMNKALAGKPPIDSAVKKMSSRRKPSRSRLANELII